MKQIFENYQSEQQYVCTNKDYFCGKDGIPNAIAFEDFASHFPEPNGYRLVLITIDLWKSNREHGYAFGNLQLKRVIEKIQNEMPDCYIFRIQGEKFNIIIQNDFLPYLIEDIFECKEFEDYCDIYYGIVEKEFEYPILSDLIREGINKMYKNKDEKTKKLVEKKAEKVGEGAELRETELKKYRNTMWYATAEVNITEPIFKKIKIYIFPTEYKSNLQVVRSVVIVDDMLNKRAYTAPQTVRFGVQGNLFDVYTRFDSEGHLSVAIFSTSPDCKCEIDISTVEGVYLPENFGKAVGKKEIFPFEKNMSGLTSFVELTDDRAILNETGIVEAESKRYTVSMDNECILLTLI